MKKLIALLLFCICLISSAIGESIATQTDLDDADWGQIDIEFPREVFLDINKRPQFIGDTVSLVAILINFKETDKITFYWQYTTDLSADWNYIQDEHEQTYTFILDDINLHYWYRVIVKWEGE